MFYTYYVSQVGLYYYSGLLYFIICPLALLIVGRRLLNSLTVDVSISLFTLIHFYLIDLEALLLGGYTFRSIMFS